MKLAKNFHRLIIIMLLSSCGTFAGNPEDGEDDDTKSDPTYDELVVPDPVEHPSAGEEPQLAENGVNFYLVDAPVDDFQSVFVSVDEVRFKQSQGEWLIIATDAAKGIDLLQLQKGKSRLLGGVEAIPSGTYTEIRLVLAADYPPKAVLKSGEEVGIHLPSAESSGLKIKGEFSYTEGRSDIVIDFDLRRSIRKVSKGSKTKYRMQPVLQLVEKSRTGSFEAKVDGALIACVYLKGVEIDASDSCSSAAYTQRADDGDFRFEFVESAVYDVRFYGESNKVLKDAEIDIRADAHQVLE